MAFGSSVIIWLTYVSRSIVASPDTTATFSMALLSKKQDLTMRTLTSVPAALELAFSQVYLQ